MLVVLLGLGTWQVQRLHWKQELLAQIARAEAAPAVPLPAEPEPFSQGAGDRASARRPGRLVRRRGARHAGGPATGRPADRAAGTCRWRRRSWSIAAGCRTASAPDRAARGGGDGRGLCAARRLARLVQCHRRSRGRQFFTLDPEAIGAALGLRDVAPFVLVALGPPPPELYPDPARHLPRPPNNHLSYAITWYGLAVALLVIFVLWARKVLNA